MEQESAELDWREIDGRQSQWLYISLGWLAGTNILRISVHNERTNSYWEKIIGPEDAQDAFTHPFAYQDVEVEP